jgi:hypothetical protein
VTRLEQERLRFCVLVRFERRWRDGDAVISRLFISVASALAN